ncbi:hypothetical protein SAMN05216604_1503 [Pseudomonas agarici]|nr:hypothetical protein SAMN05216604_1503 [Pseudomonas agarici]
MLLAPRVVHAQFVIGRRAQHIAFVVRQGHVVGVLAVVQGVGNVGTVRVALFEGDGHFGAGKQWQVQTVSVARIGTGQAQPEAFRAEFPGVAVEQEADFVTPFTVDVAIRVVGQGAADPGRDGAGDVRFVL